MSDTTGNEENNISSSELEAAKREAELAKKEAELARKEAELIKKEADGAGNNSGLKKKGGGKKVVAITACSVVFVAMVVVIVYLLNMKGIIQLNKDTEDVDQIPNSVVTEDNVEEIMQGINDENLTPPGSYELSMTTEWTFKNGDAVSEDAFIENVKDNQNSVYVTIVIRDTGEEIYKSPILKRGSHIENIKLDKALEKGLYDCVCTYHLLNKEETADESTTKIALKIKVKK